jgi:hypothetical protein
MTSYLCTEPVSGEMTMRVLVCGGRDFDDQIAVWTALDELRQRAPHDALTIIQGGASGADKMARDWCAARKVPCINVPADWKKHGRAAGPIRNQKMLDEHVPDLVLAFPGGRGTADMVFRAQNACIPVEQSL